MTPLWTAAALADATGGRMDTVFDATGVAIDTRTLRPGELFVALRGDHGDGHDHVAEAFARGAAGVMVHEAPDAGAGGGRLLLVADTRAGLTALGSAGRARFAGPVVAVTGSVGKTTTKEMLRLCLAQGGQAHAAEASHNNHWGVPLTLARLPAGAPACVVEIGMNHAGEIAPLARLARPDVAVITAIGPAHIGHLGSLEAIADEKAAIGAGLAAGGVAVLPAEGPCAARLREGLAGHAILTFGTDARADARLLGLDGTAVHSDIEARVGGRTVAFRLPAPGRHMALNALAALAATHAGGLDVAQAARALGAFVAGAGRGGRCAIAVGEGSAMLLDESYNASSTSIRAALQVLALQPAVRRLVVLGDMRELGTHSQAEHAGLAEAVGAVADALFTCGPEMRALHASVPPELRAAHADTAEQLAPLVAEALRAGDAVLVKGSLGSRMRVVVAALHARGAARAA